MEFGSVDQCWFALVGSAASGTVAAVLDLGAAAGCFPGCAVGGMVVNDLSTGCGRRDERIRGM